MRGRKHETPEASKAAEHAAKLRYASTEAGRATSVRRSKAETGRRSLRRAQDPQWAAVDRTRTRNSWYVRQYGISYDQALGMLAGQGGACAICATPLRDFGKGRGLAVVDHCHRTGRVRGALCLRCNTGLGLFDDVPTRLIAAQQYLGRTSC